MTPTTNSGTRRSQRLSRRLPVVVCGESPDRKPFWEEALTVAINAHGVLLVLNEKIELGQKLHLMNPTTWDERDARVAYFTASYGGQTYVGIEFMHPAPEFWPINDPPVDWNVAPNAARDSATLRTC
jgi:hypothetical protein